MSYILDALKRAEHERTSGPATATGSTYAGDRGPGLHPSTMILAGATLFLAGIGVAALLLRGGANPPPAPASQDPQQTAFVQPAAEPTPAPAPIRSDPVADPLQEEVTEPTAEALALDEYGSFDDITPVFQGTGSASDAAAPPASDDTRSAAAPPASADTGAAKPTAAATPVTETLRFGPPRLDDMSADYRARFPRLQLQVHVHDADPARRWIMVDGRRHREGGVLDQGPRVVEILPDGVIFEFSGQQALWPLAR